jgi:hypothetical protein
MPGVQESWIIAAAVCTGGFIGNLIVNLAWHFSNSRKKAPKLRVLSGSREVVFDPNQPAGEFEAELAEAIGKKPQDATSTQ